MFRSIVVALLAVIVSPVVSPAQEGGIIRIGNLPAGSRITLFAHDSPNLIMIIRQRESLSGGMVSLRVPVGSLLVKVHVDLDRKPLYRNEVFVGDTFDTYTLFIPQSNRDHHVQKI